MNSPAGAGHAVGSVWTSTLAQQLDCNQLPLPTLDARGRQEKLPKRCNKSPGGTLVPFYTRQRNHGCHSPQLPEIANRIPRDFPDEPPELCRENVLAQPPRPPKCNFTGPPRPKKCSFTASPPPKMLVHSLPAPKNAPPQPPARERP